MSLTNRDKAIIKDLNKFKVMDRDSIAELHFSNLKNPHYAANNVLLRLLREGEIQRTTSTVPYCYFGPDVKIKQNSAKLGHWLGILDVYKDMRSQGEVQSFLVEPKYGAKGTVEVDAYAYVRKTAFFIEVQKTVYTEKQMEDKIERYIHLYNSGSIAHPFPHLLIISDQRYALDGDYPFKIFQAESYKTFMSSLKSEHSQPQVKKEVNSDGIKIKIG